MYTSFAWGCDYGWNNHLKQINLDDLSFVCCVCNPLGRTRGCRLVLGVSLVTTSFPPEQLWTKFSTQSVLSINSTLNEN